MCGCIGLEIISLGFIVLCVCACQCQCHQDIMRCSKSLNCYNFCLDGRILLILCFSGSLKYGLSNFVKKFNINFQPIFSKKTVDYKWVKLLKLSYFKIFELNTSSCRVFCGLSENQKISANGQIKQKL